MWLGKVHDIYTENELLSRVGARDETFIFQTHDPSGITEEERKAAILAKIEQKKQQRIEQQRLGKNHRPGDKIAEGVKVRIIRTQQLGTVRTTYPNACTIKLKDGGRYASSYKSYRDVEPFFWEEDEEDDADGDGKEKKAAAITKSSFGTACLPAGRILVHVSIQSRPANMYATNANSKNEGVRVIDLKCGTTNKQVHQLIRAGLQKFFRADAGNESTDSDCQGSGDEDDDTSKATAASTAAVPTTPYDIKYENINAHYILPDDDEEFTADKLYVQVDRAFDFTEFSQINDDASMSSSSKSGAITLKSCLQRFSVEEQLDKFNEWYCPGCKNHVQAFKTMDLYRLPTILIIQLKRFEYEEGTSYYGQRSTIRNKINSLVDFPITGLDLSGIAKGPQETPAIYDLFAISNHHGGLFFNHVCMS